MRTTFLSKRKPSKLIRGAGLSDYIVATRRELHMLFHEPLDTQYIDEYKTTHEWHVEIQHDHKTVGAVAIYDYKNPAPEDVDEPHRWHVGSKSKTHAMELIDFVTGSRKQVATDR